MSQNLENSQSSDIVPGIRFGEHKNYKIIKKLGEGGMGQAWLAEKEETLANAKNRLQNLS